mgnify:CR=1 FL=1
MYIEIGTVFGPEIGGFNSESVVLLSGFNSETLLNSVPEMAVFKTITTTESSYCLKGFLRTLVLLLCWFSELICELVCMEVRLFLLRVMQRKKDIHKIS